MRRAGFTLIELTIALAIVALLLAATVMGVGAITGTKAKAAAAELAGVMRSLYDTAALTGKTCRLVFDLPAERSEDQSLKYMAECASGDVTAAADRDQMLKDANRERERAAKDTRRPKRVLREDDKPSLDDVMTREKDRVEAAARFAAFTSPEIQPHQMSGIQISVWTQHQRDPVKHGLAYLYFYPQGFTERAQVYVQQGKNVWTLAVSPLTGRVKIASEALEVPRS
jgi:general secretion pathway protein H